MDNLCDTNGGTLPHELENIFNEVKKVVPESMIGVHFHNDTDNATYNSLESIRHGITQVQEHLMVLVKDAEMPIL